MAWLEETGSLKKLIPKTVSPAQAKIIAALSADLSCNKAISPDSMASFTISLDAITSLLVASSASLPILFEPPIKAPIITQIAIMITAVLYFTTRVATAVPKVQASFEPSDQPIKSPAASNKYIIIFKPFWL